MKKQGTMSYEEKKMNRNDLKSYKAYDGKMEAMIVGINSTPEPKRNDNVRKLQTADQAADSNHDSRTAVSRSLIAHPLRNSIFCKQSH
jgi:hypothetical protein